MTRSKGSIFDQESRFSPYLRGSLTRDQGSVQDQESVCFVMRIKGESIL